MTKRPRHQPPGRPDGGQFAPYAASESDIQLDAGARLWVDVNSPDSYRRETAAASPHLTGEQIATLAGDENPHVRLRLLRRDQPGVSDQLADDPDPIVRACVLTDGVYLSDQRREQLASDELVVAIADYVRT